MNKVRIAGHPLFLFFLLRKELVTKQTSDMKNPSSSCVYCLDRPRRVLVKLSSHYGPRSAANNRQILDLPSYILEPISYRSLAPP